MTTTVPGLAALAARVMVQNGRAAVPAPASVHPAPRLTTSVLGAASAGWAEPRATVRAAPAATAPTTRVFVVALALGENRSLRFMLLTSGVFEFPQ
jgi:hypothetical protein